MKDEMYAAPRDRRARVLFAIPSMGLGGSERVMLNLLRHIDTERFEMHLVVLKATDNYQHDVPRHVQLHKLAVRHSRNAVFPFVRLCWSLRPQVVLSTSAHLNSTIIVARSLLPRNTALLVREGADITSPELACSRVRLRIYKQLYRRADLVICQSDFMKESLIQQFGLERSKVKRIYNPVDIESIAVLAESEPNPFTKEGPNLLGIGRFSHEKGFDLLVKCLPIVRHAFPTATLTLVGDGPNFDELTATRDELGLDKYVQFLGVRENPYSYMKHADLLVLPSRCEALPNVVLEAIALGTPVVTTNCTGALGEICNCSRNIEVATSTTPEALASAIVTLLGRMPPRPNVPEPQFEARFGVRAVTRQYEHVLMQGIQDSNSSMNNPVCVSNLPV